jgi:hypothetical protein
MMHNLKSFKKNTWFGFRITRKQSVQLFIGSLIIFFFSTFIVLAATFRLIYNIIFYESWYGTDYYFLIEELIGAIPIIMIFSITLLISLYSFIRCKLISKTYSSTVNLSADSTQTPVIPEDVLKTSPQFCSSCGKLIESQEKYCSECGSEI